MDDFVLSNLQESRNEWCSRLVSIFCPLVIEGVRSIFAESWKICEESNELPKYLMTFQNFLSRVPKWNAVIIEEERKRIIERSGCNYLEDLITCVHIIQLKVLTCIRVGNKQKKIDITIPKLDNFIHKVYIHVARKVYSNIYLFEKNITPLQVQKNTRELELIVQECIMTTIRESIPTEEIIRAYMDESIEHEDEVTIEPLAEPMMDTEMEEILKNREAEEAAKDDDAAHIPSIEEDAPIVQPKITDLNDEPVTTKLTFNNINTVMDINGKINKVDAAAPKSVERLEDMSTSSALQRSLDELASLDDQIKIHTENLDMGSLDLGIMDLNEGTAGTPKDDDIDMSMLGIEEI
jgi:hypothetical protein